VETDVTLPSAVPSTLYLTSSSIPWSGIVELGAVTILKGPENVHDHFTISVSAVADSELRELVGNTWGHGVVEQKLSKLVSAAFTLDLSEDVKKQQSGKSMILQLSSQITIPKDKNSSNLCLATASSQTGDKLTCIDLTPSFDDRHEMATSKGIQFSDRTTFVFVVGELQGIEYELLPRRVKAMTGKSIATVVIGCVVFLVLAIMFSIKTYRRYHNLKESGFHSMKVIGKNIFHEDIPMDLMKAP